MTIEARIKSQRIVALAILTTALLLLAAVATVGPQLAGDLIASYAQPTYAPEQAEYCPGDVLRADYLIERRHPGPVEIVSSWCTPANVCILALSSVQHGVIFTPIAPITATLTVTIPTSSRLTPGSEWVYARTVRQAGQAQYDLFTVPFRIAIQCPAQ